MRDEKTPHGRLRIAREAAGFKTATAAADRMGLPLGTYTGHENGSRAYDVKTAQHYAGTYGVRSSWLLTGEAPMTFKGYLETDKDADVTRIPIDQWDPAEPEPYTNDAEGALSAGAPYKPTVPGARPEIDVRPGAGNGSIGAEVVAIASHGTVTGHKVVNEWVIPDEFYRHELQASPSSSLIMSVIGDSMVPTLLPGDRIIVDARQNSFGPDGIYVFDDGDSEPRVKRLSKVLFSKPESVTITSDNSNHQAQNALLADVRIIGRVVGRVSKL